MNEPELRARGRRIVLAIILATLALSLAVTVLFVSVRGTERLVPQTGRFALTILLSYHLYRGSTPARWIAVILFSWAGALGATSLWGLPRFGPAAGAFAAMSGIYLGAAGLLSFHPAVRAHFAARAGARIRTGTRSTRRVPRPIDEQRSVATREP